MGASQGPTWASRKRSQWDVLGPIGPPRRLERAGCNKELDIRWHSLGLQCLKSPPRAERQDLLKATTDKGPTGAALKSLANASPGSQISASARALGQEAPSRASCQETAPSLPQPTPPISCFEGSAVDWNLERWRNWEKVPCVPWLWAKLEEKRVCSTKLSHCLELDTLIEMMGNIHTYEGTKMPQIWKGGAK